VLEFASSSAGHCKAFLERALRVLFGLLCACNIPFRKDCSSVFCGSRLHLGGYLFLYVV